MLVWLKSPGRRDRADRRRRGAGVVHRHRLGGAGGADVLAGEGQRRRARRSASPMPPPPDAANCRLLTFQPPLSWLSVSTCCPAGSVTWAVTVAQVCQPPVAGRLTLPLRLVPDAFDRCSAVGHRARRRDPQADRVRAGRRDVDGVAEPLAAGGPADVVAAAGVGGGLQVDAVGAVAVAGAVDRGDVVGDALAAGVVVLRLYRAGNRRRRAAVRRLRGGARPASCCR